MAEFCFECFKKINELDEQEGKYKISRDKYLCEECGKLKRVVIAEKKGYYLYKFRYFWIPLYILWRLIIMPYTLYKLFLQKPIDKKRHSCYANCTNTDNTVRGWSDDKFKL